MSFFGLLNVDKPGGMTSRKVVDQVARLVRPEKAGHAGTLDPLATGVLIVCVGKATRLIETVQQHPKQYRARFLLGRQSDTDDVTGNVQLVKDALEVRRDEIEALLPRFLGRIEQRPPAYSAVHVEGRRAYQRARRGETVEIPRKTVEVFEIELLGFENQELELSVCCGSGTYIRSIGRDLGELLGCGAVMSELVRTRIGPYRLESATRLEQLTAESLASHLRPPESAVTHLPRCVVRSEELDDVRHGRLLECPHETSIPDGSQVAVFTPAGQLACLGRYRASDRTLAPRPVFLDETNRP